MTPQEFQDTVHQSVEKAIFTFSEQNQNKDEITKHQALLLAGILEFEKAAIIHATRESD